MPLYTNKHNHFGSQLLPLTLAPFYEDSNGMQKGLTKDKEIIACQRRLTRTISHHSATGVSGFLYRVSQVISWIFLFGRTEWKSSCSQMSRLMREKYENHLTTALVNNIVEFYSKRSKQQIIDEKLLIDPIRSSSGKILTVKAGKPKELENYDLLEKRCRLIVRRSLHFLPIYKASSQLMQDILQTNRFAKHYCEKQNPSPEEQASNESLKQEAFTQHEWKSSYIKTNKALLATKTKINETFLSHLFEDHKDQFHAHLKENLGWPKETPFEDSFKIELT